MWVAVVCRYYSKITDALVVGWVVGGATFGAAAVVKAMVGWIKWPQFARDKYLLHTCKTRRVQLVWITKNTFSLIISYIYAPRPLI